MTSSRSAIVTVAYGHATEHLDHTFSSFLRNPGIPLHAFIVGAELPRRRVDGIQYHLVKPVPDFSTPLREIYFRRLALIDELDVQFALVVDSYDVLCLRPLAPFETILGGSHVAACVEHLGSRYILGQGYTSNFLNGGVFFWDVPRSRDIRQEIVERGRSYFRLEADDQYVINEVIQTRHYQRLRILPCQYNYRAYLNVREPGWPTVTHLDGVLMYHHSPCIEEAKNLQGQKALADLPSLPKDPGPLSASQRRLRAIDSRRKPHIIRGPNQLVRLLRDAWGRIKPRRSR